MLTDVPFDRQNYWRFDPSKKGKTISIGLAENTGECRLHVIGFAVHNSIAASTELPCAVDGRIPSLTLRTKQGNIRVICAYAPMLKSDPSGIGTLSMTSLKSSYDPLHKIKGFFGDMNARAGNIKESWPSCMGSFGMGHLNESWQNLLELSDRNNLCITSTLFLGKLHRKKSWCNSCSKQWQQLDFVIVNQCLRTEIYHSADCGTDHSLVLYFLTLDPKRKPWLKWQSTNSQPQNVNTLSQRVLPQRDRWVLSKISTSVELETLQTNFKNVIQKAALNKFEKKTPTNPAWYSTSIEEMEPILGSKTQSLAQV